MAGNDGLVACPKQPLRAERLDRTSQNGSEVVVRIYCRPEAILGMAPFQGDVGQFRQTQHLVEIAGIQRGARFGLRAVGECPEIPFRSGQ